MTCRHHDWRLNDFNDTLDEHQRPESWWLTGKSSGCKGSLVQEPDGHGQCPGHCANCIAADEVVLTVSGCEDRIAECWGRSCNSEDDTIAACTVRCALGWHFKFQNSAGSHTEEARFESWMRYFYTASPRKYYDVQTGSSKYSMNLKMLMNGYFVPFMLLLQPLLYHTYRTPR
jgi:hypothetical protein